jgi:hypothetical protein
VRLKDLKRELIRRYLEEGKRLAEIAKSERAKHSQRLVRSGSIASFCPSASHFRSTPNNGHHHVSRVGPLRATPGLVHRSNLFDCLVGAAVCRPLPLKQPFSVAAALRIAPI